MFIHSILSYEAVSYLKIKFTEKSPSASTSIYPQYAKWRYQLLTTSAKARIIFAVSPQITCPSY